MIEKFQRWLVCGGRNYGNLKATNGDLLLFMQRFSEYWHVRSEIEKLAVARSQCYIPDDNWLPSDIWIISGAATGADDVAIDWAVINWCQFTEFPADWKKYGKAAGFIRNKQMLEEGKPDLVIAFPGGKGTAMMVDLASKAGVEVIVVS